MNLQKTLNPFAHMNNCSLILILIFNLFPFLNFSQNEINKPKKLYVSQEHFNERFKVNDSLDFVIIGKDTLIEILTHPGLQGTPVRYEYKDSTFLEHYKKVAFRLYHKDSADTKTMKYWKDPINIYFSESIDRKVVKNVLSFAVTISENVDSLNISRVRHINEANFVIYYDDDYQYSNNLSSYKKSDYSIFWNKKSQIYKGYIRLVRKRMFSDKLVAEKIKDLLFGSLGWFNRSYQYSCDSYFSDCYSENKVLSDFDMELLKYHYSYGICKGTTKKSFEEQHKIHKENLDKGKSNTFIINN